MEFKSFEILIKVVGGKLRGINLERIKGFFSWIMLGEWRLHCLLEDVEAYYREEESKRCYNI